MRVPKTLYSCFAVITILAIIISLGFPAWSSTQLTASNVSSYTNEALGLELQLSVNSTSIASGGIVTVRISEFNTRSYPNEVRASSGWNFRGLSLGPCGTLNYPIGILIMKGKYGREDIWIGHPLQLYPPGMYGCPLILAGITSYNFDASSDLASVGCGPNVCERLSIEADNPIKGSWSTPILPSFGQATFQDFLPGVYTAIGGDEWGGILVLHFTVS